MRLSIVFLFLGIGISMANNAYAQHTTLSLNIQNTNIANILEAVEKQTDFSFIYDGSAVDMDWKASVNVTNKSIFDVLNQLFANTDIAYTVVNKKITLCQPNQTIFAEFII